MNYKVGDKVVVYRTTKPERGTEGCHGDYFVGEIGEVTDAPHQFDEELHESDVMVYFDRGRHAYKVLKEEIRPPTKLEKVLE